MHPGVGRRNRRLPDGPRDRRGVGLRSPSTVLDHLRRMEARGIVVRDDRRSRSYRLTG
ncbi:hypothetical protein [Streptomyces sp. NPDC056512]|uniref:LexA family protein n=1 Tax=Streptomyces sp. NPDC056512 TaxID=3345846 RepID=UPI0036A697B0